MIVLKNSAAEISAQLKNAIAKCLSLTPKVRVRFGFVFGQYLVSGSKGNFYQVTFRRDSRGLKIADCECAGGEKNLPCYHVAAALPVHCARVAARGN